VTELDAAGATITEDLPDGAARLADLTHDGETLTPDGHAACSGRGAYFVSWNPLSPVWYCASPAEHGHVPRVALVTPAPPGGHRGPDPLPDPAAQDSGPGRRPVIEGNRAWAAAAPAVAFDLGWIASFRSPANQAAQVSLVSGDPRS
jgi:hypothetical protein